MGANKFSANTNPPAPANGTCMIFGAGQFSIIFLFASATEIITINLQFYNYFFPAMRLSIFLKMKK